MLFKKMLRTVGHYKAQFISMIVMVALGVGIFLGFNMEWYTIKVDTSNYFSDTNFVDYRIINEKGFSTEDLNKIKSSDGIDNCSRYLAIDMNVSGSDTKQLAVNVCEDPEFLKLYYVSGEYYSNTSSYAFLSDKYAAANNIKLGDTISLSYLGKTFDLTVGGLVKHSAYMVCTVDENQLMPNYDQYGYVIISPEKYKSLIGLDFYSEIRIISNLDKKAMEKLTYEKLGKTYVILSHSEDVSYEAASGEIEEGKTMGSLLPILFLVIAILTMVTTMHRITTNEKIQIGTLKALGFKDRRITFHYSLFGLFIGLIGSAFGIAIGYGICAIIMNPNGMMGTYFDIPNWDKQISWVFILIIVLINLLLLFISYLSVRKVLKGNAADTLRPYTPKKVKNLLLEKTKLWDKLSFSTKWNLRDVFRNKSRSFMTIFGIMGCMVLMISAVAMKDTLNEMIDILDTKVLTYESKISLEETISNEEAIKLANKYNGDLSASIAVKLDDEPTTIDIYDSRYNFLTLLDKNNNTMSLESNGCYICKRISDLGYNVGDTITLYEYGSENTYEFTVIGIYRSLTSKAIVITKECALKENIEYTYNNIYTNTLNTNAESNNYIKGISSKKTILDSYNSFTSIMDTMVYVLIVASLLLGTIVLYNLGVMSYIERYKELSTLKVVGYKDKKISKILITQNIWLTIVGIIIGIPAGWGCLVYLCYALGRDYELHPIMKPLSLIICILLTVMVSLLVSVFVAGKNKKIDMVSSLKGNE